MIEELLSDIVWRSSLDPVAGLSADLDERVLSDGFGIPGGSYMICLIIPRCRTGIMSPLDPSPCSDDREEILLGWGGWTGCVRRKVVGQLGIRSYPCSLSLAEIEIAIGLPLRSSSTASRTIDTISSRYTTRD